MQKSSPVKPNVMVMVIVVLIAEKEEEKKKKKFYFAEQLKITKQSTIKQ